MRSPSMSRRAVLAATFVLALLPAAARAAGPDPFAEFRIPANTSLSWTGNLSGYVNWSHVDQPWQTSRRGYEDATASTEFWRVDDSDARTTTIYVTAGFGGSREHDAGTTVYPGPPDQSREFESLYRYRSPTGQLSLGRTWYAGARPWFVGASASGSAEGSYQSSTSSSVWYPGGPGDHSDGTGNSWSSNTRVAASLSAGIGHVRDATGIYEARILEDRLLQAGVLARPLEAAGRQALADLLYARADLTRTQDRPAATAWRAVEKILRDDGALREGGAAAEDWFRLVEPFLGVMYLGDRTALPGSPISRRVGMQAGVLLTEASSYYVYRYHDRTTTSGGGITPYSTDYRDRTFRTTDQTLAGVSAEYHRPLGMRRQVDARARLQVPVRTDHSGVSEDLYAAFSVIVADRWMALTSAAHMRDLDQSGDDFTVENSWAWNLTGSLQYYVTNHVTASISARLQDTSDNYDQTMGRAPYRYRTRGGTIQVGLGYRFAGRAVVPGVQPR